MKQFLENFEKGPIFENFSDILASILPFTVERGDRPLLSFALGVTKKRQLTSTDAQLSLLRTYRCVTKCEGPCIGDPEGKLIFFVRNTNVLTPHNHTRHLNTTN